MITIVRGYSLENRTYIMISVIDPLVKKKSLGLLILLYIYIYISQHCNLWIGSMRVQMFLIFDCMNLEVSFSSVEKTKKGVYYLLILMIINGKFRRGSISGFLSLGF